ncbi:MAG: DUF4345 domain-containing protein [Actinomycetota bacterium]
MTVLQILHIAAALATAATGLFSLLAPTRITGFTGLQPVGGRGITELRAVLGALFIALGVAPLFLGATAYLMLGIGYLAIGAVRAVSMVLDRSVVQSNVISLITEIVLGVILIL